MSIQGASRAGDEGGKSSYHIGVLDKAFAILMSVADGPKTVVQLSEELGLNWNTTYRIVRNLEDKSVLRALDGKRFAINLQVFQLGNQLREAELIDVARSSLIALAAETEESAFLSIRQGLRVTVIDRIESPHPLRLSSRVGSSRPLHAGAMGKLLLAFAPPEVLEQLLRTPLERMTPNTIIDPNALRREIETIRQDGVALTFEENTPGSSAVAAPVHDSGGSVVAALSIGGPTERVSHLDRDFVTSCITKHAERISADLATKSF